MIVRFSVLGKFDLNPGIQATFPWLSQLASNFEEYEWVGMIFECRSSLSEGNTNNPNGSVILATAYNPYNQKFATKNQMENYDYAQSSKFTNSMFHGVECDPRKNHGSATLQIRTGAPPSGQDLRDFDVGNFQVAVSTSNTTATTFGELWVHYKVILRKSRLFNSAYGNASLVFQSKNVASQAFIFGTAPYVYSSNALVGTIDSSSYVVSNCQPGGTYLINATAVGSASITAPNAAYNLSGATGAKYLPTSSGESLTDYIFTGTSSSSSIYSFQAFVTVNSDSTQFVFQLGATGTLTGTVAFSQIVVTPFNVTE